VLSRHRVLNVMTHVDPRRATAPDAPSAVAAAQ
jgi:hypothetical protein